MKKFLLASLLSASVVSFALAEKIVVAATPIPHAEILEQIKPELPRVKVVAVTILKSRFSTIT